MKTFLASTVALALLLSAGCATSNSGGKSDTDPKTLAAQLKAAHRALAESEEALAGLRAQVQTLEQLAETLKKEKLARGDDAAGVRAGLRAIVQEQLASLKAIAARREFLDYLGGELIERTAAEGENLLLVDFLHPLPASGALHCGQFLTRGPMQGYFCVLRPANRALTVIWKGEITTAATEGICSADFKPPVSVEKDDLVGLCVTGRVEVPFDPGTGDTRWAAKPATIGAVLPVEAFDGKAQSRSYAFGVRWNKDAE